MSRENVEIVRASFESFQRGDYDAAMDAFDQEIEYDLTHFPDGKVYRGHDGVREAFRIWMGTWDDFRQELDELIDAGDTEVIAVVREFGRGKGSGIALERPTVGLWTMRNGKAVRIRFFERQEDALEAAGLSE
jgi:ketosteroid isomerase-like protein